jgi:hypothetical protein
MLMIQNAAPANPFDTRIYEIFVVEKLTASLLDCPAVYLNSSGMGSIVVDTEERLFPEDYRALENATVVLQTEFDLPADFDVKRYLTRWIHLMQMVRAKRFSAFLSVKPKDGTGWPRRYSYDSETKQLIADTPMIGAPYPLKAEQSDRDAEVRAACEQSKRALKDCNVPLVLQELRELLGK